MERWVNRIIDDMRKRFVIFLFGHQNCADARVLQGLHVENRLDDALASHIRRYHSSLGADVQG